MNTHQNSKIKSPIFSKASESKKKSASNKSKAHPSGSLRQSSGQAGVKTMAELLASQKTSLTPIHNGDIVEGKVTKLTSGEVLVDINAKAEAVVLEKDKKILSNILSSLKLGDIVSAQILNAESDKGHPVVSLRRFLSNKLWRRITDLQKNKNVVDITINEIIRGGILVSTDDGISGFLPNSQISFSQSNQERPAEGVRIKAVIIEADRGTGKLIFSQSQSVTSGDFIKSIKKLKKREKVKATISNVTAYGLFVSLPIDGATTDGFIHISEIAWKKVVDLSSLFNSGDAVEAEIIGFDQTARRVNLSIKKLKSDPFDDKMKNYPVDKKVTGKVREIISSGAAIDIEDEIDAFIKKEKIPPTMALKIGDNIDAVVSGVDTRRRRILLTPILKEKPLTYR